MALVYSAENNVLTPLKEGSLNDHVDFFLLLLNHVVSVESRSNGSQTSLRAADSKGHLEVTGQLLMAVLCLLQGNENLNHNWQQLTVTNRQHNWQHLTVTNRQHNWQQLTVTNIQHNWQQLTVTNRQHY
jgi:hypothetical protein